MSSIHYNDDVNDTDDNDMTTKRKRRRNDDDCNEDDLLPRSNKKVKVEDDDGGDDLPNNSPPSSTSLSSSEEEEDDDDDDELILQENSQSIAQHLTSKSFTTNIAALNYLLTKSADHELNYSLGEGGESIVRGLTCLFDRIIGWDPLVMHPSDEEEEEEETCNTNLAWISNNHHVNHKNDENDTNKKKKTNLWIQQCQTKMSSTVSNTKTNAQPLSDAEYRLLDAIILIVRNLTYVASNLRFLAYSTDMIRVLTGCLYDHGRTLTDASTEATGAARDANAAGGGGGGGGAGGTHDDSPSSSASSSSSSTNLCSYAIHALINLAPFIDATGRKLFVDQVLVDPTCSTKLADLKGVVPTTTTRINAQRTIRPFGQATKLGFGGILLAKRYHDGGSRDETLSRIPDEIVQGMVSTHVQTTFGIFGALSDLLDYHCSGAGTITTSSAVACSSAASNSRSVILSTLELLRDLVDNADNQSVFLKVPNSLLHNLVFLLWVPRLGPDSLEYVDPVYTVVSRVSTLKLLNGYDATIDFELRDKSVELLIRLTNLSFDAKRRLGRCWVLSNKRNTLKSEPQNISDTNAALDTTKSSTKQKNKEGGTQQNEEKQQQQHRCEGGDGGRKGYLTTRPNARLYESLLPMLSTKVGRNDASQLASRLLANLALVEENRVGMLYVEKRIVELSSMDADVANVAFNGILNQILLG